MTLNGYSDSRNLAGRRHRRPLPPLDTPCGMQPPPHAHMHPICILYASHTCVHASLTPHNVECCTGGSTSETLLFQYTTAPPQLLSLHPIGGPTAGGSIVNLTLAQPMPSGGIPRCLFGPSPHTVMPATLAAASGLHTSLLCAAPPLMRVEGAQPPGEWCAPSSGCTDAAYAADGALAVPLAVTLNGNASDGSAALPWLYHRSVELQYVTPVAGLSHLSTVVDVIGLGLLDFGGVVCRLTQPGTRGYIDIPAEVEGGLVARVAMHDARKLPEVSRLAARSARCALPPLRALPSAASSGFSSSDEEAFKGGANYSAPYMHANLRLSLDAGQFLSGGSLLFTYRTPIDA